jgi:hypothetical protein
VSSTGKYTEKGSIVLGGKKRKAAIFLISQYLLERVSYWIGGHVLKLSLLNWGVDGSACDVPVETETKYD